MQLCKGYSLEDINSDSYDTKETLYAVLPDTNKIYKTEPIPYSSSFDKDGRVWTLTDTLPSNAEFIGNYPIPLSIQK